MGRWAPRLTGLAIVTAVTALLVQSGFDSRLPHDKIGVASVLLWVAATAVFVGSVVALVMLAWCERKPKPRPGEVFTAADRTIPRI